MAIAMPVLIFLAALFPRAGVGREVRCHDSADCTADLQAAIGAGGDIELAPGTWIVRPIFFTSNHQTVTFGPDVEVVAKRGYFHHGVLFTANGTRNLTILGRGTRWRMQKADYINPLLYNHSEFRAGLSLKGCDGCWVQDITISDTGGDGVYVDNNYGGSGDTYANDIELLRITTQNAFRNGLSIISARNLRVSNCSFLNTSGTPPMSGVDVEPDVPWVGPRGSCAGPTSPSGICNRLENISLENLIIRQNPGSGISIGPGRLGAGATVDIRVSDVVIEGMAADGVNASNISCHGGNGNKGISVGNGDKIDSNGTAGQVSFRNIHVSRTAQPGLEVEDKIPAPGTFFSFTNCTFDHVGRASELCWGGPTVPLLLHASHQTPLGVGGFAFHNCSVLDDVARPFIKCDSCPSRAQPVDIHGSFRVVNQHGCTTALDSKRDKMLPPSVVLDVECEKDHIHHYKSPPSDVRGV